MRLARQSLNAVGCEVAYARVDLVVTNKGPVLMELELIEPQLFIDFVPEGREKLAEVIVDRLNSF